MCGHTRIYSHALAIPPNLIYITHTQRTKLIRIITISQCRVGEHVNRKIALPTQDINITRNVTRSLHMTFGDDVFPINYPMSSIYSRFNIKGNFMYHSFTSKVTQLKKGDFYVIAINELSKHYLTIT